MLNYSIRHNDGYVILDISGSLDVNTVESFKAVTARMLQKDSFMINLESVSTITASGIDCLVEVSDFAKKHNRRIIFLLPDEELIKMVETLDYSDFLIFAHSVEEGMMKIKYFTD